MDRINELVSFIQKQNDQIAEFANHRIYSGAWDVFREDFNNDNLEVTKTDLQTFLENYNLQDYYKEFEFLLYIARDEWLLQQRFREHQKQYVGQKQDQEKINSLEKDLKNLSISDLNNSQIASININFSNKKSQTIKSPPLINELKKRLIELLENNQDFEPPKQLTRSQIEKEFGKTFLRPIFEYLREIQPEKFKEHHIEVVKDFWKLFYRLHEQNQPPGTDWFKKNVIYKR